VDHTNNKTYSSHGGEIEYNIGVNQSLRINTTADECFSHNVVRDLQDVIESIKDVDDISATITKLKEELAAVPDTDTTGKEAVQKKLDAANKAYTFLNDKMHTLFSKCITKADQYLDKNNVALTDCGTRSKRLELIENRLDTQLGSLKELKSENEDADLAETAIQMKSAEYSYNASLMATSKILQETLLNYI
jgi:flagellar hook-associated protein 3 FlgL